MSPFACKSTINFKIRYHVSFFASKPDNTWGLFLSSVLIVYSSLIPMLFHKWKPYTKSHIGFPILPFYFCILLLQWFFYPFKNCRHPTVKKWFYVISMRACIEVSSKIFVSIAVEGKIQSLLKLIRQPFSFQSCRNHWYCFFLLSSIFRLIFIKSFIFGFIMLEKLFIYFQLFQTNIK